MSSLFVPRRRALWAAAVLLSAPAARAQFNASIQGTVTDPQGAVIPGAEITLTNTETNVKVTRKSSGGGVYTFNQLAPSTYTLEAKAKGFESKKLDEVRVTPEQANSLNIALVPGSEATNVTVNASEATALDTETASVNGTITSNQIQHLPSFGRDVFQLAQLTPGSFGDGAQLGGGGSAKLPSSVSSGSTATSGIFLTENAPQITANGGQNETNGISINGISTVSAVFGGASIITPSEDSVKDVHIVSNGYDASGGRFSGAQIQVVTQNGTNQVHGSGFFKLDRPGLNAFERFNTVNSFGGGTPRERGVNRNESRFNQFGGSIGGPFWKDHVFGFFAYEGLQNSSTTFSQGWFESSALAGLATPGTIAATYLGFIGEAPASIANLQQTCATISLTEGVNCRTVPGGLNLGSPRTNAARGTLDPSWVSSQNPGIGNGLTNTPTISFLNTANPNSVGEAQYNGRIDVNITRNDTANFSVYWVPLTQTFYNGPVRAANFWNHNQVNDAYTAIWDHTFSPTLLNEARANLAGFRWNEVASNPQAPFGLPISAVDVLGTEPIGPITGNNFGPPGPSNLNQHTYGYGDTVTKVLSRQNLRFGGDATRLYYLNNPTYNARPQFQFRNLWDFLNDAPYQESGSFSPQTGAVSVNRQDIRSDLYGLFIQDDWKVKPNLTLNLGIRWNYFGPLSSKQNNLAVFQQGPTGTNQLTDASIRVGGNLFDPQVLNFGPQLGFAWSPEAQQSHLVFRGGFGLSYNQEEIAIQANGQNNPPLITSASFGTSTAQQIDPAVQYNIGSSPTSLFGYPNNPAAITTFGPNNIPTTGSVNVAAYPGRAPTNYTYHYSLDTEYEVVKDWVATIGYQGSVARHLLRVYNENVVAIAQGITLNPTLRQITFYGNDSNSNYNALITSLRHNFSHQFQAEAQYTWAKSLDEGSQPYFADYYPYNNALAYGRSDYNVTNVFKIFGLYQPTFFSGGHTLLEKTLGGWSVSGILNLHSGFPWTPVFVDTGGGVYYNGSGYQVLRPAAYSGGAGRNTSNNAFLSGVGNPLNPVNVNFQRGSLSYFAVPTFTPGPQFPAAGALPQTPGVQRNSFNGPNYIDADLTVSKAFGLPNTKVLGERAQVEARANAYNIYNRLNLASGGQRSNGGAINDVIETANGDGTFSSNPNFGQDTTALGSRTVEIQFRLSF